MFFVEDVLIADAIRTARFGCRLQICLGKCCEEGESGAPLTEMEAITIETLRPQILPYLDERRQAMVKEASVVRESGRPHTPLDGDGGPCVYLVPGDNGVKTCSIEMLYRSGKTGFQKPVSCHLFPLIYGETPFYRTLSLQTRLSCVSGYGNEQPHLVEFLRQPLIRQFGEKWVSLLFQELGLKEPVV